ncbi:hypothetical protein EUTSA_v10009084mg [Eutrema salsugineum]|uniref:PHD-type zinc finger plants domain-containing protein n=1 Tax=Eutrema salsugineum TaxID=72664 RepID=V4LAN8_EUTSA|nr:uncharacterized protein LOC18994735 [Eutrema salsugineum]ESQ36838.1 hypothetical protein EUTSA_v10009084mg [Eutrema salsugineum]
MERVCSMCGDVGFPDKLFRCGHCRNRFQHSYCSNYYSEFTEPTEICDWCRSDDRKMSCVDKHGGSSSSSKKTSSSVNHENEFTNRSEYSSGGGIKHNNNRHDQGAKTVAGAAGGGVPSPRTATRRYKLLKDVMC